MRDSTNISQAPPSWNEKRLNEIAILINGKAFKESEWANQGLPIVRIQNLKDESAPFNYYQGEPDNQFMIDNGELLFSWSGSKGTSFGPHFWQGESAVLNQHIFKVLIKPEIEIDKFFLYYYLLKITTNIEDLTYGLAALVHVRKKDLENVSLYLPPLPEQRAIARALRAVQGAREARLRELALERERKAALMEHLFTHGTRGEATKMTDIGEMPESWNAIQLENACTKIVDCPHSTPRFSSEGILVARNFNIRSGKLDLSSKFFTTEDEYNERIKRCKPLEGDILFSREAPVGESCLVPSDMKLCLGQRMMLLRADPFKVNNFFLVQTFYANSIRLIMNANSSGVTAKHLNVADVKRLKIPHPLIPEQNEIAAILRACDSKITALDHEARMHDELFGAMIEELMSGKLSAAELVERTND